MQEKVGTISRSAEFKKEIEIERKWSVEKKKIPELKEFDHIEIEQGYFKDQTGQTRRLRKYKDKQGEVFFKNRLKQNWERKDLTGRKKILGI